MNSTLPQFLWALPICIVSCSVFADQTEQPAENSTISGNIGVVSKYIYRGGEENQDLAIQGGLAYAYKSGITFGYWGSTLGYDPSDDRRDHGFEHNFYVSYGQEIDQNWRYNLKTTAYVYHHGGTVYAEQGDHRKTDDLDVLAEIIYKNLTVGAAVMLADSSYANAGDVYLSAAYSYPLAHDFAFNTSVGGSFYNTQHDNQIVQSKKNFTFNEARIGMSKPVADTGIVASFDYVIGGESRVGDDYDDHVVFGLIYNF